MSHRIRTEIHLGEECTIFFLWIKEFLLSRLEGRNRRNLDRDFMTLGS